MTDREAYVAFALTEQTGSVRVAGLVSRHGSVAAAWDAWPRKTARAGGEVAWRREFERAAAADVAIVTPADAAYPAALLELSSHPLALYVKGDPAVLSRPSIAIVGTRRATAYGLEQAQRIAGGLAAAGWSVVSGLALGIDAASHRGALDAGGVTAGVIGSGLDRFYPEENAALAREMVARGGAVASPFPFGRPPDTQTFPQRNRVVAALARGTLAIEAPARSGTLITTRYAADLGRVVMALPGRVDSRSSAGCLSLLRDGARLVRSAEDVVEELSDLFPRVSTRVETAPPRAVPAAAPPPPSPDEAAVLRALDAGGLSMDELIRRTGLTAAKAGAACMTLRVKGRVRFFPGNRVALPQEA